MFGLGLPFLEHGTTPNSIWKNIHNRLLGTLIAKVGHKLRRRWACYLERRWSWETVCNWACSIYNSLAAAWIGLNCWLALTCCCYPNHQRMSWRRTHHGAQRMQVAVRILFHYLLVIESGKQGDCTSYHSNSASQAW